MSETKLCSKARALLPTSDSLCVLLCFSFLFSHQNSVPPTHSHARAHTHTHTHTHTLLINVALTSHTSLGQFLQPLPPRPPFSWPRAKPCCPQYCVLLLSCSPDPCPLKPASPSPMPTSSCALLKVSTGQPLIPTQSVSHQLPH